MELVNPVSSLVRFETDLGYTGYQGSLADASGESAYALNVRTTFPIPLSNGNNILLRLNIPLNGDQPLYEIPGSDEELSTYQIRQIASTLPQDGTFDHYHGHSHLGEVSIDAAYGGVSDSGFISMFGIAAQFPTSQDISQRSDQVLLGPEIALGQVTDWGIYGGWLTHMTNIGGDETYPTSTTTLELFFAYGLGNGWQVTSNPVLAYDWEGEKDNRLFLPLGGGVAKTTRIGTVPVKLGLEVYTYLESPDSIGPDWLVTFSITPALRNPLLD
ncbi:MAG: hypothetical protein KJN78_00725 [Gammaproteobacteria bacterium]|nr:hypothetical protein [Gammaproteobacteria bacterium]